MATLYIGDLAWEANESDINDLFSGFDVRAIHMKFGFCFVEFRDREQARVGLALDGTELFGKRIRINWARSRRADDWAYNTRASSTLDSASVPTQNRGSNRGEDVHPITSVPTQIRLQTLSESSSSLASSASSQSSTSSSCLPSTENTLLECEICFVRFDYHAHRPRSLPCGHSLCSLCITDTLKANLDAEFAEHPYLLCPFCRTSCGPHKTRVGQFPETFFILKMLEVEAEKAKKVTEKEKEQLEKRKRENEEKKKEEEKKIEERREKERKNKEEEYIRFQKQMIGLDSTVSGIISCNDHLESLEDLHKEQLSVKCQLKTHRKKLLEEVGKIESEIMELSEQMLNTEVWITSGKNLLTKFENIQEDLNKENNEDNIETSYDAAERCCLATQRWSEGSLPEIEKMDLFIKQKQVSSSRGSLRLAVSDRPDQGASVKFDSTEGTDTVYKSGEPEQIKTKLHVITQMKEYCNMSFEELRVKYYLNRPNQKCSTCCNKLDGATAFGSQTMENKGVLELSEAMGEFIKLSENSSDAAADFGSCQSLQSSRKVLKRSKLGFLFEKTRDVSDTETEPEISSAEPAMSVTVSSVGDNSTSESISRSMAPFVVTNTTPSFNFGSTINPFQANLLGTTTAVSPLSIAPRVSATSFASIAPLSAVDTTSSTGSSHKSSPVKSDNGKSTVSINQRVSGSANSTTLSTFQTNSAKTSLANTSQTWPASSIRVGSSNSVTNTYASINFNSMANTAATSSVRALSSSCETSTASSSFSMGNLSHPFTTENSNISTSVADASKQITPEDFSFASNSSASVRPKVNSACELTTKLTSFPRISTNNLSQSESSLCSTTTFAEQKDLTKRYSNNSNVCRAGSSSIFSGFKFDNGKLFTLSTAALATNTTTNTSTNASASTFISQPVSLDSSPSSSLPVNIFGVRDVGTMTSDYSSPSPIDSPTAAVELVTTIQTNKVAVTPICTVSSFSALSTQSTRSSNENFSSKLTNDKITLNCSTTSESVRPKMLPTSSSQVLVNNTDSKYSAINAKDDGRKEMFTKEGILLSESSCDNGTTKSLPSFTFTMSPGKFSGISFSPLASTNTKTLNSSDNAMSYAGLSISDSTNTTPTSPTTSKSEPISFCLKPNSFNFSLAGAAKKVNFLDYKNVANSDCDILDNSLPE